MMDWSIFSHSYLQNALVAGFCAGITCAVTGVFVVTMHLSFLGVCIAHAAFAGALMSLWLQVDPLLGSLVFSLVCAALVGPMADRGNLSPDASIGILFSLMLGLSFLFFELIPGSRTEALSMFWGSILTVGHTELVVLTVTCAACLTALLLFFKEIQAVIANRQVALAVGIPATLVFYAMLFSTGFTIAVSLRSIGGLLIYSLVINPAAAAFQITYRLKIMFILAGCFGVLSCWSGLAASYYWDLPAGASIVLVSSMIFAISTACSPKKKSLVRAKVSP